jgi:hypothetical protein
MLDRQSGVTLDMLGDGLPISEAVRRHTFIVESNRIEGIDRPPTKGEVEAHRKLWDLDYIDVTALKEFVANVAARPLRSSTGMDVRVGPHIPPPGGPEIERELDSILRVANSGAWSPYDVHVAYETLHPFMDGNGRSGRALWAWQMLDSGHDPFALPFLHRWYYQSLDGGQR